MTASWPSLDGTLMRTRPCKMAIILWPGAPLAKIVARAGYRVRCADARTASASSSLSPENRRVPLRRSRPLANADPIKFAPQSAVNRAAGLFRYGRTLAHEAQLLLIESSYRRLSAAFLHSDRLRR